MYRVGERKKAVFEFEYRDKVYSVPAMDSLPLEQVMSFAEAADGGSMELAKWVIRFFTSETNGAVSDMSLAELTSLAKAWQGGTDMGESQASSD